MPGVHQQRPKTKSSVRARTFQANSTGRHRRTTLRYFNTPLAPRGKLPEAVKHKHKSVVTVAVAALYATGVRPTDRFMCPSSPAWGHGLAHGTLGPLGMGASISTYSGEFRPERLLEAIKAHKITNLSAAATHYRMMRASPQAEHYHFDLEKASFTGEALDGPTAAWAKSTFGTPICSIYGTTEVGVILAQYPGAQDLVVKPGSLGRPMPGLDIQVLDEQGKKRARQIKSVNSSPTPERLVCDQRLCSH